MSPEAWIAGAAVLMSITGPLVAYGALRQKVTDVSDRVSRCEDRHVGTETRVGSMEVDLAVLKERSGTTITTLDRIEGKLDDKRSRSAPRPRAAK